MNQVISVFFAANPHTMERLNLDKEANEIERKIRSSNFRDSIRFITNWATRTDDLLEVLNTHSPQIVHFSGHGTENGEIVLIDENGSPKTISPTAIELLFGAFEESVHLVILNSCFSEIQASAIINSIDCAIGMHSTISDDAAIRFVGAFYLAIASGRSVKNAFDQGRIAIILDDIPEDNAPKLLVKSGKIPSEICLIQCQNDNKSATPSKAKVKFILGDEFANYTKQKQDEILGYIRQELDEGNDLQIIQIEQGSVVLSLEVPEDKLYELLQMVRNGKLSKFNVNSADYVNEDIGASVHIVPKYDFIASNFSYQLEHQLDLSEVTKYLHASNWKLLPDSSQYSWIYERSRRGNETVQLELPKNGNIPHFADKFTKSILDLAAIEDTTPEFIIQSIKGRLVDLIEAHVFSRFESLLPFSLAAEIVAGLNDLLKSAANTEENPLPLVSAFVRTGRQYAAECYFGHTFAGSFGFQIESPLSIKKSRNSISPFNRRIIERIVRGLKNTEEVNVHHESDILISNYKQGFNANMCEALLGMLGKNESIEIEYRVKWAPFVSHPEDIDISSPIRISSEVSPYLETAAEKLRAMEQDRPVHIQGLIEQLRGSKDSSEDNELLTVVIPWFDEKVGRNLNVYVKLGDEHYRAACDAFRDVREVSVYGNLQKRSGHWQLVGSHTFGVI